MRLCYTIAKLIPFMWPSEELVGMGLKFLDKYYKLKFGGREIELSTLAGTHRNIHYPKVVTPAVFWK